jgi:integrase
LALYRRKNSSVYWYDFTEGGVRFRGSTKEKILARARSAESELIVKARNRQLSSTAKKPLGFCEFADIFKDYVNNMRRDPGTKSYYQTGLKVLLTKPLAAMRLDQITAKVIDTTAFEGSGSHVNCSLRTLNRMMHLACEWGYLVKVPKVKMVRERKRTATFDGESEDVSLTSLPQPWRDVLLVMLDAGMRNQEAVALRWEHVNFENQHIYNPRVKAQDTDGWIPMSDRLKVALLERSKDKKSEWAFPSKTAKTGHLWPNVSRPFSKMRQEKKLPKELTPYAARHTFGTDMLALSGDIVFVGKLMGHRNVTTTARYMHPSIGKAKELLNQRNAARAESLRHIPRHTGEDQTLEEKR